MFDSTDDVAMCYISNGHFFGKPEYHLVYINTIYGMLLSFLYSLVPYVEWYSISFLALHVLAFSVVDFFVLKNIKNRYLRLLLVCSCLVMWCRLIVGFQFTTTSGVLCLAGCMLLIGKHWDTKCFGIILITVASLLRFNMAAFVGVVFCPIILYSYKLEFIKYLYVLCLFILVLLCKFIDKINYQSPEWLTYTEYNHLRSGINDNPNANVLFTKYVDQISHNDVIMVLGTEQDPSIIDCSILKILNDIVHSETKYSRFWKLYQMKFFLVPLCLFALYSVVFFFFSEKKTFRWIPLIILCILVLFMSYISINNYLKPRAVIPVLMAVVLIYGYCFNVENSKSKLLLIVVNLLCVVFSGIYLIETIQISKKSDDMSVRWEEQKEMINKHDIPTLWPSDLCEAGINPLHIKDNPIEYIAAGWMIKYPKGQVLQNHKELLTKTIGIMLSKSHDWDKLIISHYITSLQEHYGIFAKDSILEENEDYRYYMLKQVE